MNLNEPVFDSVLAIDEQLKKLQLEVKQMDNEFKGYKPPSAAASTAAPDLKQTKTVCWSDETIQH